MGSFFGSTRNQAEMMGLGLFESEAAPLPAPYEPTAEEQKLLRWAWGRKAFGSAVKNAIQNYIYRKEGATLAVLTNNQLNELRTQANSLGVSLER